MPGHASLTQRYLSDALVIAVKWSQGPDKPCAGRASSLKDGWAAASQGVRAAWSGEQVLRATGGGGIGLKAVHLASRMAPSRRQAGVELHGRHARGHAMGTGSSAQLQGCNHPACSVSVFGNSLHWADATGQACMAYQMCWQVDAHRQGRGCAQHLHQLVLVKCAGMKVSEHVHSVTADQQHCSKVPMLRAAASWQRDSMQPGHWRSTKLTV